VGTVN